jgi:hypothetical protein
MNVLTDGPVATAAGNRFGCGTPRTDEQLKIVWRGRAIERAPDRVFAHAPRAY